MDALERIDLSNHPTKKISREPAKKPTSTPMAQVQP